MCWRIKSLIIVKRYEPVSQSEAIAAACAVVASDRLQGKTSSPKVVALAQLRTGADRRR